MDLGIAQGLPTVSRRGSPASIPGQMKWDLWWTK
jgi:hypothetical protein